MRNEYRNLRTVLGKCDQKKLTLDYKIVYFFTHLMCDGQECKCVYFFAQKCSIFTTLLLGHSRSAHLFGAVFWYWWCYLWVRCILWCMGNITPGGSDTREVGTNGKYTHMADLSHNILFFQNDEGICIQLRFKLKVSNVGGPPCDNNVWVIREWVTIIFTWV